MAFSIGSISAQIGIDTSGYSRGILTANALTQTFGQTFTTFLTNPVLGGINVLKSLGKTAIGTAKEVLGFAEAMQRLSQQTGITTDTLQALRAQMIQAGFSAELAESGLVQFANRLGEAVTLGGAAADIFTRMGVSLDGVASTEEGLRRTLDAIAALPDEAQRAAAAADIFGRFAGTKIINAVGGGADELDRLIANMVKLGQVTNREGVDALAGLNTTLGITQQALEGFRRTAVIEFLQGFIGEVGTADQAVTDFAGNLNARIGATARELGQNVGELVGNLDQLVDRLDKVVGVLESAGRIAGFFFGNGAFTLGSSISDAVVNSGFGGYVFDSALGFESDRHRLAQPFTPGQFARAGQ